MIYVLAYPDFDNCISASIDHFRSVHEPERAKLVPPHVTLVFGLRNVEPGNFIDFCSLISSRVSPISVQFSTSKTVHDPFESKYKKLLSISVGREKIISLHEQLYDGPHRCELHPDFPFEPHMTIATNSSQSVIDNTQVDSIGSFPIHAKIKALQVVRFSDNQLHPLEDIILGS